jgi:hypothetical protein
MKSRVFLATGLALSAVSGVLGAPAPASAPRASLRAFTCQRAFDPPTRGISVQSVMRPVPGTQKLAVRFQLLRKSARGIGMVRAGDLGAWISPADPTLGRRAGDVWQLTKSVADLAAPAQYRFRVGFRWTGAHGRVLAQAVRLTARCDQPELRPDLVVESIAVAPLGSSSTQDVYVARIENHGASPTGAFQVRFEPADGSSQKVHDLKSLAPHAITHTSFRGPICAAAGAPTIVADPSDQVDDRDRSNNSLSATCP